MHDFQLLRCCLRMQTLYQFLTYNRNSNIASAMQARDKSIVDDAHEDDNDYNSMNLQLHLNTW
jgi:hypothetical protein